MAYTIKQLADLAGVTVRTLHYYDTFGLLKPTEVQSNGYRLYEQSAVLRLQQILFFRELDFSLRDIKRIIAAPNYSALAALHDQKRMLQLQQKRLTKLINTINQSIKHMEQPDKDTTFEDAHALAGLSKETIAEYKKEVYEKYDPKLVQQSMQRVKKWGKDGLKQVMAEGSAIVQTLAELMPQGPAAPAVQSAIADYHQHMNKFYDCSIEIFQNLGAMYEADPRFAKNYTVFHPDMPRFMNQAITIYVQAQAGTARRAQQADSTTAHKSARLAE